MIRRKLMWGGVVALFIAAFAGLWAIYGTLRVILTEAEVQERVNKQLDKEFSLKGKVHLLVKTVSIKSATVHIRDGLVAALIDMEGVLRAHKNFALTVYAVGRPTYAAGAFYFKPENIAVQKFSYEGSTPTELLTRFGERYISDDKVHQLIEDSAPKVEKWMTNLAENAAMHSLEKRPVYRPKDDVKGILIKASLESVKIDQDKIVITFSLWQFTLSVLIGFVCLIAAIAMTWVLIRHSLLWLPFIALS